MPAGVRPPNFHGKKGRSGRKCKRDEQLRIRVIEKAWLKKEKRMNDNDAIQIVVKDMTQKSDITSDGKELLFLTDDQRNKIAKRIIGRKSNTGGSGEELLN